ncbi:MAG: IS200/IS605 family transposase [Saprospiraceae bacterium]|nr:IS200/IS605 family transposase [Saprospiraceae bacterium]
MANTYHQIHIQTVFAVKFREGLILPKFRQELFGYIGQTINDLGHKTLIINGVADHVHCFFGLYPKQSLSDLMQKVKSNASGWINEQKFLEHRFEWQKGFGAFSYAKSQVNAVYKYVQNQEAHHKKRTFRAEYLEFLQKFEIEHDEKYIFHEPI